MSSPGSARGRSFENVLCKDSTENLTSIILDANKNPMDDHNLETNEVETSHSRVVVEYGHMKLKIVALSEAICNSSTSMSYCHIRSFKDFKI